MSGLDRRTGRSRADRVVWALNEQNLKSPQELEEEDRQAKSAVSPHPSARTLFPKLTLTTQCRFSCCLQKLQELIRRGTPKDLLAAQELMKDLSGAVRPTASILASLSHPLNARPSFFLRL